MPAVGEGHPLLGAKENPRLITEGNGATAAELAEQARQEARLRELEEKVARLEAIAAAKGEASDA
jgi:transcription elongation GreA/GreB family factor